MAKARSIEILEIGSANHPLVVIDGFCDDPERWRREAASCEFRTLGDFYPGRRVPVPREYLLEVAPLLSAVLQNVYRCTQRMVVERALFSVLSTPPDQLGLPQRVPHIDSAEPGHFALVHYLSHGDFGGTAFYRHRSTGFEAIGPASHRAYLDRLQAEFARYGEPAGGYIDGDTNLFERIGQVAHCFNRAVLYPSNILHCSANGNGLVPPDDPLSGRLTVAAFMLAR